MLNFILSIHIKLNGYLKYSLIKKNSVNLYGWFWDILSISDNSVGFSFLAEGKAHLAGMRGEGPKITIT